jgi:hypothetical protein
MKNTIFLLLILLALSSCDNVEKNVTVVKCAIDSCEVVPVISVHDEIMRKRWRVYSCGRIFPVYREYKKGDTIEIQIVEYR